MTRLFTILMIIFFSSASFGEGLKATYSCNSDKNGLAPFQFEFEMSDESKYRLSSRLSYKSRLNSKDAQRTLSIIYDDERLKLYSYYFLEGKKIDYPIKFESIQLSKQTFVEKLENKIRAVEGRNNRTRDCHLTLSQKTIDYFYANIFGEKSKDKVRENSITNTNQNTLDVKRKITEQIKVLTEKIKKLNRENKELINKNELLREKIELVEKENEDLKNELSTPKQETQTSDKKKEVIPSEKSSELSQTESQKTSSKKDIYFSGCFVTSTGQKFDRLIKVSFKENSVTQTPGLDYNVEKTDIIRIDGSQVIFDVWWYPADTLILDLDTGIFEYQIANTFGRLSWWSCPDISYK